LEKWGRVVVAVLLGYIVLGAVLLYILFKYQSKHLHVLEIFVVWCAGSLIIQNYFALQTMNFHSSRIPDIMSLELANLFHRTILYPVVILLFLNRYSAALSYGMKIWIALLDTAVFTGLEWLTGRLGVFIRVTWPLWGSAFFWLFLFGVAAGILRLMRMKLLAKV
jgi:hypothetical protein